jgi:transposase-like protein
MFKRRRFPAEIILPCVRWYCRYGISYQDLEKIMAERGVAVDHVTLYRWIQRYAPELEKRVRWYQGYRSSSWRVDETYVKVAGKWKYLFRAIDKHGRLIDFMLSNRRNTKATRRFLPKALKVMRNWPLVSRALRYGATMWMRRRRTVGISAGTMRRPSRGLRWSGPILADSACNIGRPKHPTPSWGGRVFQPGENSGPGSDIRACAAARN